MTERKHLGERGDVAAVTALTSVAGMAVVDVGCGAGRSSRELAALGAAVLAWARRSTASAACPRRDSQGERSARDCRTAGSRRRPRGPDRRRPRPRSRPVRRLVCRSGGSSARKARRPPKHSGRMPCMTADSMDCGKRNGLRPTPRAPAPAPHEPFREPRRNNFETSRASDTRREAPIETGEASQDYLTSSPSREAEACRSRREPGSNTDNLALAVV